MMILLIIAALIAAAVVLCGYTTVRLPVGLYAYPKTAFCPAIRRRRSDGTAIVDYRQGRRESVFHKPDNGAILLLDKAVFV